MKPFTCLFFTTGGTAGHIFPAVSVIEEAQRVNPEGVILFLGAPASQEERIMQQRGIPFVALRAFGVMGKGLLYKIRALCVLSTSIVRAYRLCKKHKPDCIFAFGGYASLPCALGGKLAGIPVVLHEQNIIPGMANKFLAKVATTICISFEETKQYFPGKHVIYTGNPVRSVLCNDAISCRATNTDTFEQGSSAKEQLVRTSLCEKRVEENVASSCVSSEQHTVLVVGGSLGAKSINTVVMHIAKSLIEKGIRIIHQTGRSDYERVYQHYQKEELVSEIVVQPFFDDIQKMYALADLVICRAGATTLTELAHAALPAIVVPFPQAVHDHQWHNAMSFARHGAVVCFRENNLSPTILHEAIFDTLRPDVLHTMRTAMQSLAVHDSAKKVLFAGVKNIADKDSVCQTL